MVYVAGGIRTLFWDSDEDIDADSKKLRGALAGFVLRPGFSFLNSPNSHALYRRYSK